MAYRPEELEALTRTAGAQWLDDLAMLAVSGDDAKTWLNGQLTNDLRDVDDKRAVYGLFLTARGKVLSDAWVVARGASLGVVVKRALLPTLVTHLEKYVIMEDVTLEPRQARVLSVQGPKSEQIGAQIPGGFACDRLGGGGWEWIAEPEDAGRIEAAVAENLARTFGAFVSVGAWDALRIERATPAFGVDFWDAHYPQEAGLEARAVSFSKGCYLGQEVVCTLENRGQINRRLVQLKAELASHEFARGDSVTAEDGTTIGEVTSGARTSAGQVALGYVKRRYAAVGTRVQVAGNATALVSTLS